MQCSIWPVTHKVWSLSIARQVKGAQVSQSVHTWSSIKQLNIHTKLCRCSISAELLMAKVYKSLHRYAISNILSSFSRVTFRSHISRYWVHMLSTQSALTFCSNQIVDWRLLVFVWDPSTETQVVLNSKLRWETSRVPTSGTAMRH